FLRTPPQRERLRSAAVEMADPLNDEDTITTPERSAKWWVGLGVAAAIALLVGGIWLRGHKGQPSGSGDIHVAVRQQPTAPHVGSGSNAPSLSLPTAVFMTLSPGRTRSAREQQPLGITNGVTTVRLQLNLEQDEYPRYDASLETPEG